MILCNKPTRIINALFFFLVLCLPLSQAVADNQTTEKSVRQTIDQTLAAFENENLDETLKVIHPNSPNYAASKQQITSVFKNHDIDFQMIEVDFIGESGPYAFVRAKEKSAKVSDTDFRNNVTEVVLVFRKHGTAWKLWGEYTLETVFEDQ